MITQAELKSILHYEPTTGVFTWLVSTNRRIKVGDVAGSLNHTGYIHIKINKKLYMAHRLAWLYVHGSFPTHQIDHINGNRSDNRICNLREATPAENQQNRTTAKGYHYDKFRAKWYAQIKINGKTSNKGRYNTENEAREAYLNAKKELHTFCPISGQ